MSPSPSSTPDEFAALTAADFVRAMAPRWHAAVGNDLIGLYLIGSLAHGGFSRRYSDIDVALITERGVTSKALEKLHSMAAEASAEIAGKLSFFWTDRAFSIGRFPPLDRIDYLDRAVTVIEREHVSPPRPSLAEVRAYLAGAPLSNWIATAEKFAAAATLHPDEHKSYLRALLYPARFVVSFMTARMLSNDDAVEALSECAPAGLDTELIGRALACRQAAEDPDALFAERAALLRQAAACTQLVAASTAEKRSQN
jgi:hypothetical protein